MKGVGRVEITHVQITSQRIQLSGLSPKQKSLTSRRLKHLAQSVRHRYERVSVLTKFMTSKGMATSQVKIII